jgi:hypothetical protein
MPKIERREEGPAVRAQLLLPISQGMRVTFCTRASKHLI